MPQEISLDSDQRFRALIEHSSDAIVLLTPDGTVTYASSSTERVSGYLPTELVGRSSFALLHPEDLEAVRQQFAVLLDRPGDFIIVEYRICHKNGAWRWMEATATNLLHDPTIQAIVVNFRDTTERKQAEEERHRLLAREQAARAEAETARARLYDLLMQAPAAMSILRGLGHRYEFANPLVQPHRNRADILGKTVSEVLPEVVEQGVIAILDEVYTTGTPFVGNEFPVRFDRRGDGVLEEAYYTFVYQPLRTVHGEIEGILTHSVEVTEQVLAGRRVEELNRQLEARASELEAILEAMTEGVVVCDARGEIRYTNAAYRSLMALEDNANPSVFSLDSRLKWMAWRDLEGRPLPNEQHPMQRVLRGERLSGTQRMDALCHTYKGEDLILNISGAPICDAAGQSVGGVVVFRDVTERLRLQQQLQYSERKFRSLVESNILGVVVADVDGRVYEVNERIAQMVGYSRDELLTFNWRHLVPPDAQEAQAQMTKTLLSTGVVTPQEGEYLRKDGSRLPVLAAATLLDQERRLALGVVLDISDRKEVEQRKKEFLNMVSHELRTPLTSIMGLIELALMQIDLRPRSLSPEAERMLGQLEKTLKRADGQVEIETRLVEELLEVSRLELHKFELTVQPENLVTIVQETVANQQQVAPTRQIELALPLDEAVPVLADAGRIGQVLTNYLINAFKYAPVDRVVSVCLDVEANVARVSVRDQGPGLTPEQQLRVWERYYQVEAPGRQGPDGGLGLGLAIAKAIVEQHLGQVGVESAPGHGATFWFALPLEA